MTEATTLRDASDEPARAARRALRQRLIAERDAFVASPDAPIATVALSHALTSVLAAMEPGILGLYCALPSEFNAASALDVDAMRAKSTRALPFARRSARTMEFRRWDGSEPVLRDECGIGSCAGAVVVPDVVVVPCIGFTAAGHRLGYGGGYYDRWLAAHPQVTAIGVAWSASRIAVASFAPQPHDIALALIVTERGVVADDEV